MEENIMMLFKTIDGLLVGTKYLSWAIGLVGIVLSLILAVVNLPLGLGAASVFIAAFFAAAAITLLLLPTKLAKGKLDGNRRYIAGAISLVIAVAIMAVVWGVNGGFPALNLLFM